MDTLTVNNNNPSISSAVHAPAGLPSLPLADDLSNENINPSVRFDGGDSAAAVCDYAAKEKAIAHQVESMIDKDVRFQVDLIEDRTVLQITNSATGEVIRSIPSEEMIALMERLELARSYFVDCAG